MAVLDEASQKIVVRIVYDGPVRAGKSTNLRKLCQFLTPLRRSDLVVPEELSGRTLFFDWLRIEGGVVGGHQLRCHFVTVPGQAVLNRRRRFLLEAADAVVFVCESTPKGVRASRELLGSLRDYFSAFALDEPPFVLQANKQDLPGALELDEVVRALGLSQDAPAVAASAESGTGIRETAVLAIRAAANQVQKMLLTQGPESLAGRAGTAEELHRAMLEVERESPLSPTEALRPSCSSAQATDPDPPPLTVEVETRPRGIVEPPLPDPNAPSGTIWPSPEGREVLRSIHRQPLEKREDLVGQPGASDGSGRTDAFIYRSGDWCLKTSLRRRYHDPVDAKSALLELVRAKIRLGSFAAPGTVLSLAPEADGAQWLWTVTPWLTTLRAEMSAAEAAADEAALGRTLQAFARTAVKALALAARAGVSIDVHPSNFASVENRYVYLDDDIGSARALPAIGYSLLQRVEEYAHRGDAVALYLDAIEMAIPTYLTRDEADRLELESAIEQAVVRSDEARRAQTRLRGIVSRAEFAALER